MKTRFLFFIGVFLSFYCHQTAAQYGNDDASARISVTPLGTFSYPLNDFGENYRLAPSGGLKAGFNTDVANGKLGINLYLAWYNDRFKLRGSNDYGMMNSGMLGWDFYLFYLVSGMGWGSSRFDVSDEVYQRLGNSTGTELQGENKRWNFTYDRYFGLRVPLGSVLALECQYHFISVEKSWMYWHSSISGTIIEATQLPFEAVAAQLAQQDKMVGAIIFQLISAGISWAWYNYDYNHHNWPWNDARPMRYGRATVGVNFCFGDLTQ